MKNNDGGKKWADVVKSPAVGLRNIQQEQGGATNSGSWEAQVSGANQKSEFKRPEVHVYLAGQDADKHMELLETLGMKGNFPNIKKSIGSVKDGRIVVLIAEIGSREFDTEFEIGAFTALNEVFPNVLIIGYSTNEKKSEDVVVTDIYGGKGNVEVKGSFEEAAVLAKELSDKLIAKQKEEFDIKVARSNQGWAMS